MTLESSHQSQRCTQSDDSYLPVNVAHIEDGAVSAVNTRVAPRKLDGDGGKAEVGTHGEIGDGGYHCHQGGDVVEDTMGTGLGERKADKTQGSHGHD